MKEQTMCENCEVWQDELTTPCGVQLCEVCAEDHRGCIECATELTWERADYEHDRKVDR